MLKHGCTLTIAGLCLLAAASDLRAAATARYNVVPFGTTKGLPSGAVLAVTQTRDGYLWVGTLSGLARFDGLQFVPFNENNTPGLNSSRIVSLFEDSKSNLWVGTETAGVVVVDTQGKVTAVGIGRGSREGRLVAACEDSSGGVWLYTANGQLRRYRNGKLDLDAGRVGPDRPSNCRALIADESGFIWVGTSNGVAIIQCPQEAFTNQGCDAIWPVVKQGNFAGYLFNGEEVRSIAVDGADRKWVATKNGVWLISATGEEVIYRFTEENSPLFSNDVKKIAIDGKTGEIYFATAKGICSFRSTATEGTEVNEKVLVFPNPVPPGYGGTIGIRGLVNDAIVKITELDGRLVYQARALGGQAVWDGKDYKGRKISSGVYLVLVSNDDRTEKTVAKIVFIGK